MAEARSQSPGVMDLHTSTTSAGENSTASTDTGSFDANLANVVVDLQCPATPTVHFKLPELSSSSSDSEPDELQPSVVDDATTVATEARRDASPPPNCAICLGRCKNKCYTDSCRHQFCFKCLCEWSKVKPECPLCKQTFKSIIHNVKANNQFEEYHVQPPTVQIPNNPYDRLDQLHYVTDVMLNRRNDYEIWDRPSIHSIIRGGRTIWIAGSSSTNANGASGSGGNNNSTATNASSGGVSVQSQYMNNELLQMYRQEYPDAIASTGTLSQLWRRYVYDRKLYALPVCDITGRLRESSARFYRDNPAQIHRLMPWINRDIVCLLRNTQHSVSAVLENINESLTIMSIVSPAFRRRIQPYLGLRTSHFIHELNNFARSPYDMIGYDRAVQYSPQAGEEIVIEFSTSASSDEEFDGLGGPADEHGNIIDNSRRIRTREPFAAEGVAGSAASAAVAAAALVTAPSTSASSTRNGNNSGSIEYRMQSRGSNTSGAVTTTTTSSQPSPNSSMVNLLSFSISTTSEGTEAPGISVAVNGGAGAGRGAQSTAINLTTHNRSNEVIIDSDTDSENALVIDEHDADEILANVAAIASTTHAAPTVVDNIELTTGSSDECEFVLERKPPHLRTPEMVSLNSESDSDVVFVDELKTALRKSTFSSSGCEDEQNQSTTAANSKQKLIPLVQKKGGMQSLSASVKHEEELYNVGASTSTGLRSSGGRRGLNMFGASGVSAASKCILRSRQKRRRYSTRKQYSSANEAREARRARRGGVSDSSSSQLSAETASSFNSDSSMSHLSSSDEEVFNASLKRMKLKRRITRKPKRTNQATTTTLTTTSTTTTTTTSANKRNHYKDNEQTTMKKKLKLTGRFNDSDNDTFSSDDEYESLSLKELKGRLRELKAEATYPKPTDDGNEVPQQTVAEENTTASTTNIAVHEQQNTSTGDDEEIVQYLTTMKAQKSATPTNKLPSMTVKNELHAAAAAAAPADGDVNENERSLVSTTETIKASSLSHNSACSPTTTLTSASSSDTSSSASTSSALTSSASSSESAEDSDSNDDDDNKHKNKEHNTSNPIQQTTNIFDMNSTFEQMLNAVSNADSSPLWPADAGGSILNGAIDSSNELHHLTPQLEAATTLADFANTDTRLNFDLPIYSEEGSNDNDNDNDNVEHENNL